MTHSLSEAVPRNRRVVPGILRPASELHHEQGKRAQKDLALSSDSEAEDYYVDVSGPEDTQQPPKQTSTPAVPPTEGRRPVRPKLPRVRSLRSVIEATRLLSKKPQPETRRRRVELTADRLAKVASDNPLKSTKELAEELTAQYSLTPEERRRCLHLLRGMRVAQRHLCGRIRRAFPMTNSGGKRLGRIRVKLDFVFIVHSFIFGRLTLCNCS